MKNSGNRYYILAAAMALILGASCTKDTEGEEAREQELRFFNIYISAHYPDAVPQPSGLYYLENSEGEGAKPGPEDWVLVNHVSYLIPDDAVYDTYIENVAVDNRQFDDEATYGPYKMLPSSINVGLNEGIGMMREGGEATLLFTSDLGYGSKNTGTVSAYRSLKYEIELLEVIGTDFEAYEQAKIDAYLDTVAEYDTVYDVFTELAIPYMIDDTTDGPVVGLDSTLAVAYKGYLLDGRVFDEASSDDPFIFKTSEVEWGARWDLVLPRLREGEKARMIFPYQLAYGELGDRTTGGKVKIPPFETLIFDIEILSVEAGEDDTPGGPE
jgi:FKBP-type peptidyl-prolyl cis-trans isomerase FkpA